MSTQAAAGAGAGSGTDTDTSTSTSTSTDAKETRADVRIQSLVARTKELEGQLRAAQAGELQSKYDSATAKLTELETQLAGWAKKEETWATERVLMRHGLVDDEARDVALFAFGRLAAEGKPKFEAWIQGVVADPSTAPLALRPYLGTTTDAGSTTTTTPRVRVTPPGGTPAGIPGGDHAAAVRANLMAALRDPAAHQTAEDYVSKIRAARK